MAGIGEAGHEEAALDQAVRFNSATEEISPNTTSNSLQQVHTVTEKDDADLAKAQRRNPKELSASVKESKLQSARMDQFVFDPVSLPPSRVPSGSSSHHIKTNNDTGLTPRSSPISRGNSQLLTPADSGNRGESSSRGQPTPSPVTPQVTPPVNNVSRVEPPDAKPSLVKESAENLAGASSLPVHPKPPPIEVPQHDSNQASSESSPLGSPKEASHSGQQSPYSRPFTPVGDPNDPYSRSKRLPQTRNLDSIDARFVFGKERPRSGIFGSQASSRRGSSENLRPDKRGSFFGGARRDSDEPVPPKKSLNHGHHHSMSDLKRFFKLGGSKKDKREKAPVTANMPLPRSKASISNASIPGVHSRSSSNAAVPFGDDHGLEARYGKFEKILGSGAGGSVRLMKRADGVTFAVKQFREKHTWETEKAYNKKITAEFCVGSTMHHGNIIEAMDIINEKGRWYEVMEYAPYDLFAIVMTGKMAREEVACAMMQILNGVAYLHSMGLAHRDLKLDNVVVNEHGILKIIDFGSAHVFQYPFEGNVIMAEGVVGSDPYLAPEVFTQKTYDAQRVDIWSLAIIFCCMSLRRFPWKCPKQTDNSFKLFISEPSLEELKHPIYPQPQRQTQSEPTSRNQTSSTEHSHHHHRHHDNTQSEPSTTQQPQQPPKEQPKDDAASTATASIAPTTASTASSQQQITIKGPWRLLRLLPRETRHIIGRMLDLDPLKRATLDEITADAWIEKTPFCRQEEGGQVVLADNHTHTLEGGSNG